MSVVHMHNNTSVRTFFQHPQGGGQMVLVFYNELPPGNKFVTFYSRERNNSITVDTTQENSMVLYALIPSEEEGGTEGVDWEKGGRGEGGGGGGGRRGGRNEVNNWTIIEGGKSDVVC